MAVKFTNNAATTLAAGINSSVTSIAVTDGSVFPTITGSDYFYVTFDDGTNKEIVKVTARSSNTLTVVRGHDDTTARAFSSGDKAELRVVAALLSDVIAGVGSSALTVDTFSGNGSTTAFTLSTTPAGEDNLIVFIEGVYQNPVDFTLSGTTLTFDVAPANGRNIIVYHVAALVSGNNLTHNQFTCNGSTTAFTLSLAPIHENNTQVFLNGVYQHKNTYAVSGTTLTLDTAPANGVILEVMSFTQTDVNTLPASFVSGLTQVTAVGADHFMIFDATDSQLKKSLVSDVLESATSISTSADATAITIDSNEKVTFTSDVTTGGHLSVGGSNNELRFYEGSNYVGFEAPALSADKIWVLPAADGSNGQALTTNGSGTLSFTTISGGASDLNGLSDCKTFGTNSLMIGDASTGTINAADNNTGVGVDIFAALTTGDRNTTMGTGSMAALTTGANNVGFGAYNLASITASNGNTAIGYQTQQNGDGGEYNVSVGYRAGRELTSGDNNVFLGAYAGDAATSESGQVAIGYQALTENNTNGTNIAIGYQAGSGITSGASNISIGYQAYDKGTTGYDTIIIGNHALDSGSAYTGYYNTFVGNSTARNITSAICNTTLGNSALTTETVGSTNTAIGYEALKTQNTGYSNTAVGNTAGKNVTTGDENCFLGDAAGLQTTSGSRNIAIGYRGGRGNSTGSDCIIIGSDASYTNCTGSKNIAIGNNAGYNWTTAYNNTNVGYNARSDEYNSYGSINLGYNATGRGSTWVTFGHGSDYTAVAIGSTNWSSSSDERMKENIQTSTAGLSFINDLRPVTFDFKMKKDIPSALEAYEENSEKRHNELNPLKKHGFIAQEVKTVLDNHSEVLKGSEIWSESKDGTQGISMIAMIPMLVKALQEADDKIDALTARIETLEG